MANRHDVGMTTVAYFAIIAVILAATIVIAFKLYMAQRRSRIARVFLDGLGLVVILPTIAIVVFILDFDPAGRAMTGFGAFVIYSVVSLGVVPLLTIGMVILSIRLVRRTYRRSVFS